MKALYSIKHIPRHACLVPKCENCEFFDYAIVNPRTLRKEEGDKRNYREHYILEGSRSWRDEYGNPKKMRLDQTATMCSLYGGLSTYPEGYCNKYRQTRIKWE